MLIYPKDLPSRFPLKSGGPDGEHAAFLRAFGPFLMERYRPKALVVFSAHWETTGQIEITDYRDNHLLYDYYGFPKPMYDVTWKSHGSSEIASRVESLLGQNNIRSKRLKEGGRGIDHGVFVPFMLMFPDQPFPIPVTEVSIPSSLDPKELLALGKALEPLRYAAGPTL